MIVLAMLMYVCGLYLLYSIWRFCNMRSSYADLMISGRALVGILMTYTFGTMISNMIEFGG